MDASVEIDAFVLDIESVEKPKGLVWGEEKVLKVGANADSQISIGVVVGGEMLDGGALHGPGKDIIEVLFVLVIEEPIGNPR